MQVTPIGEEAYAVGVPNPTDAPISAMLRISDKFDPLARKQLPPQAVTIAAGSSVRREF